MFQFQWEKNGLHTITTRMYAPTLASNGNGTPTLVGISENGMEWGNTTRPKGTDLVVYTSDILTMVMESTIKKKMFCLVFTELEGEKIRFFMN